MSSEGGRGGGRGLKGGRGLGAAGDDVDENPTGGARGHVHVAHEELEQGAVVVLARRKLVVVVLLLLLLVLLVLLVPLLILMEFRSGAVEHSRGMNRRVARAHGLEKQKRPDTAPRGASNEANGHHF
jgi:hypothetical protein